MTSSDRLGTIQINFDHHDDTTISKIEFDIVIPFMPNELDV